MNRFTRRKNQSSVVQNFIYFTEPLFGNVEWIRLQEKYIFVCFESLMVC